jgi:hypothetical protein
VQAGGKEARLVPERLRLLETGRVLVPGASKLSKIQISLKNGASWLCVSFGNRRGLFPRCLPKELGSHSGRGKRTDSIFPR